MIEPGRLWLCALALACRDPDPPPIPAVSPPKAVPASRAAAPPVLSSPTAPQGHAAPAQSIADAFGAEPVDDTWKPATERAVKQRVPDAADVECRRTLCRITLVGNEQELARVMDRLESDTSLRGIAQSVLLTAPDKQADGKLAIRAYARFARTDAHREN